MQKVKFSEVVPAELTILGVEGLSPGNYGHFLKVNNDPKNNVLNLDQMLIGTISDPDEEVAVLGKLKPEWNK